MIVMLKRLLLAALFLLPYPVLAQGPVKLCTPSENGAANCLTINPQYPLAVTSQCNSSAVINVAAGTTSELVALTANQTIRVCSFVISGDTIATTAAFVYGTGTNCGSGTTSLTGAMRLQDEGNITATSTGVLFKAATSNALCLTTLTGAVTGFVTYTKY